MDVDSDSTSSSLINEENIVQGLTGLKGMTDVDFLAEKQAYTRLTKPRHWKEKELKLM